MGTTVPTFFFPLLPMMNFFVGLKLLSCTFTFYINANKNKINSYPCVYSLQLKHQVFKSEAILALLAIWWLT